MSATWSDDLFEEPSENFDTPTPDRWLDEALNRPDLDNAIETVDVGETIEAVTDELEKVASVLNRLGIKTGSARAIFLLGLVVGLLLGANAARAGWLDDIVPQLLPNSNTAAVITETSTTTTTVMPASSVVEPLDLSDLKGDS